MKVHIGKHINWIGPYQIASMIFAWVPKIKDCNGFYSEREFIHRFGDWLAEDKNGEPSWFAKLCEKIHAKRKRKISVRVDNYDTWNADHTLALIILPVLERLVEKKHGSGHVDDSDVPIWLHSTLKPGERDYDIDGNFHQRWDWVIGEMIWAFREKAYGSDDQFFEHMKPEQPSKTLFSNIKIDHVGLDAYNKRMQNGFRLFGKYYNSLWD